MYQLTGSIVAYNNDRKELENSIQSFLNTSASNKLYVLDNSPRDLLRDICEKRCEYLLNDRNLGFGKAHNIALQLAIGQSKYHLVLNPDVSFAPGTLDHLLEFMEKEQSVGLVIPKVLDFDSRIQPMCKRLPTPLDLIIRRLNWNFLTKRFHRRLFLYEMKDKDYEKDFEVPYISGCFMLFRVDALKKAGLFDERFFMYMEDVDLSRRVHKHFRTTYFPGVHIFHGHARESYLWNKQFIIHMISAIKYFDKWGWFADAERKSFNR